MQIYMLLTFVYIFYVLFKAIRHKKMGAKLVTLAAVVFSATAINDILYNIGIIETTNLFAWGLLFFILIQALIISKRFNQAYDRANQLSEKLNLANATLEKNVEDRTKELTLQNQKLATAEEELQQNNEELAISQAEIIEQYAEVEAREKKYRVLFEKSDDAIFLTQDGILTDCNSAAVKLFGFKNKKELLNTPAHKLAPEQQADGSFSIVKSAKMKEIAIKKGAHKFEWIEQKANGETFPAEVSLTAIPYKGKFIMHAVSRDLTERKKAIADLQKSEAKFRTFFERNKAIMLQVNPETKQIISVNKSASEFYGYSKVEFLQKSITDLNALSIERVNKLIEDFVQSPTNLFQTKHRLKDGTIKDVEIFSSSFGAEKDKMSFLIIQDITERKKAQHELKTSNIQLKYLSKTGARLISYARETRIYEFIGRSLNQVIPNSTIIISQVDITQSHSSLLSVHGDLELKKALSKVKNKTRPLTDNHHKKYYSEKIIEQKNSFNDFLNHEFNNEVAAALNKITDINKMYSVGIIRFDLIYAVVHIITHKDQEVQNFDFIKNFITQASIAVFKKQLEKSLAKESARAETANRLKTEFLANMSHEVRTPMNAIIGFSNILKKKIEKESNLVFVEKISQSGQNLLNLINDILDLSKIEAGQLKIQKKQANIHTVLNEIPLVFSEISEQKQIPLKITIADNIPNSLLIDTLRIRQILLNLASNALKFTEFGTVSILLTATKHKSNDQLINLKIEVTDTGIGIPENQISTIFESFRQVQGQSTRQYGGTGLGLAITKRLAELMDGTISAKSKIGEGSTFTVTLKNVEILAQQTTKSNTTPDYKLVFEQVKILQVDDVADNREIISLYLEDKNIELKEAENGKQALEILENYTPDLILMDIQMPELNGYETTKIIRQNEKLKHIPVIAVTANATKEEVETYSHVFDKYLTKPIDETLLLNTIAKYLDHKTQKQPAHFVTQTATIIERLEAQKKQIKHFPQGLKKAMQEALIPLHKQISTALSINDVKAFAQANTTYAKKYQVPALAKFSDELLASVQDFNLGKIKILLNDFKGISHLIITE